MIKALTDDEWLYQHRPHASEAQEDAFLERVAIMLEYAGPSPTWAQVEYARQRALEKMQ
jgi:hypothetical protein